MKCISSSDARARVASKERGWERGRKRREGGRRGGEGGREGEEGGKRGKERRERKGRKAAYEYILV